VGAPPGTIQYTGERASAATKIIITRFNEDDFSRKEMISTAELEQYLKTEPQGFQWIRVIGFSKREYFNILFRHFKIHEMTMEDIFNVYQRPKIEQIGDALFAEVNRISILQGNCCTSDQVAMLLDGKTLLTFQDFEEDFLQSVEKRIENHNSLIRKNIQFLFYSVIDTVVDEYYVVLEKLNDKIEEIEELFIGGEVNDNFKVLQLLRNEMRKLRQAVWPLREIINKINKNEFLVISEDLSIYFNDLNDNMKQIIELLENMRETTLGLIDVYMSYVSNRLNDIMKVLTIISTVFIPLTFITGIYGMNFHFMPEIEEPWGYPAALSIMVVVVLSSVLFFKKKKWF